MAAAEPQRERGEVSRGRGARPWAPWSQVGVGARGCPASLGARSPLVARGRHCRGPSGPTRPRGPPGAALPRGGPGRPGPRHSGMRGWRPGPPCPCPSSHSRRGTSGPASRCTSASSRSGRHQRGNPVNRFPTRAGTRPRHAEKGRRRTPGPRHGPPSLRLHLQRPRMQPDVPGGSGVSRLSRPCHTRGEDPDAGHLTPTPPF